MFSRRGNVGQNRLRSVGFIFVHLLLCSCVCSCELPSDLRVSQAILEICWCLNFARTKSSMHVVQTHCNVWFINFKVNSDSQTCFISNHDTFADCTYDKHGSICLTATFVRALPRWFLHNAWQEGSPPCNHNETKNKDGKDGCWAMDKGESHSTPLSWRSCSARETWVRLGLLFYKKKEYK